MTAAEKIIEYVRRNHNTRSDELMKLIADYDVERAIAESQAPHPGNVDLTREVECECDPMYSHRCMKCGGRGYVKRKAELGDGEPSAPPQLQKIAEEMADAIGEKFEQVIKGEECKVLNLTTVVYELLRTHFGAAQEVSPVGYVSEIRPRPDAPSCDVCGAEMVWASGIPAWKCLSCGKTKRVEEVSPPSPQDLEELVAKYADIGHQPRLNDVQNGQLRIEVRIAIRAACEDWAKQLGDTRELKAALKEMIAYAKHGTLGEEAWPENLAEAERLLGEPT